MANLLYIANDNLLQLLGLKDERNNVYINGASVTAQLKNASGDAVGGVVTLSYASGSNGDYAGILPDSLALTKDAIYLAEITADNGADQRAFWKFSVKAVDREA